LRQTAWKKIVKGKWHWFDLVFLAVRTSWLILALRDLRVNPEQIIEASNPLLTTGALALVALWLTASYLIPLVFYFSKKLKPYSPLIELVLMGPLVLYFAGEPGVFDLYNLPVFTVGYFSFRKKYAWYYLPTVIVIPLLAGWIYDYPLKMIANEMLDNTVMFIIGICLRAMITGHTRMKEMVQIIQDQNQTLELYSKQIKQLTIVEERNRIASELHDTVGHTFTSTILGMEAVYYQMDHAPDVAKAQLKELVEFARTGYEDVRRNIHQMAVYENEKSLVKSLAEIAAEFGEHTRTHVVVEVTGEEQEPFITPESIRIALIRCLQEALTNAKRHGRATEITVSLTFTPQSISMKVVDNGTGQEKISAGFGLNAMNQRITGLNGTMEISSKANLGTSLTCTIPLKAG
jgi:signal transduction histidine kinase